MTESADTNHPNPEESPPKKQLPNFLARVTGVNPGWLRSLLIPTLALLVALIFGAIFIALG